MEAELEPELAPLDRMAEGPRGVAHTLLHPARPRDGERAAARVAVDRGEQQRGNAPEVVAVIVGDDDGVDLAAVDA